MIFCRKKKKRKDRPKTSFVYGICGMIGEIRLMEEDWRDRGKLTEDICTNMNREQKDVKKLYSLL